MMAKLHIETMNDAVPTRKGTRCMTRWGGNTGSTEKWNSTSRKRKKNVMARMSGM